jgi:hypothetical protein
MTFILGSAARRMHSQTDGHTAAVVARPANSILPCSGYPTQATETFGWSKQGRSLLT